MNSWLYLFLVNTPPLDWFGFLGIFAGKLARLEDKVDLSGYPEFAYNRKLEIFSFCENVFVYLAIGIIFGYLFKFLNGLEFARLMFILWSIAYSVGITADAILIHKGYYFTPYKRFKGISITKIFKLFIFIIYHSAIYVTLGLAIGRFVI